MAVLLLTASFPLASFQYNSFDTYSIHVVIYPCHVVNSVRLPLRFVRFSAATAAFFLTDDFGVSWQSTQFFLSWFQQLLESENTDCQNVPESSVPATAAAGFSRILQDRANPCLAPPPGLPQMPCRLACPAASAMPPSAFPSAPARPTVVRPRSSPGLTPRHHPQPHAKGQRAKDGKAPRAATLL